MHASRPVPPMQAYSPRRVPSAHAHLPVEGEQIGVSPLHSSSSTQSPSTQTREVLPSQERPLPSVGSQARHALLKHWGVASRHCTPRSHVLSSSQVRKLSPWHCLSPTEHVPHMPVSSRQTGFEPEHTSTSSQPEPSLAQRTATSSWQAMRSGWHTTQIPVASLQCGVASWHAGCC